MCFWLQVLSCVYYGVFLAMTLLVFVPALLLITPRERALSALPALGTAFLVASALTLPFMLPYRAAAQDVGGRAFEDIARYSAHPMNYFSTTSFSWMWGWTSERWGGSELRLFPGATALVLAMFAFVRRPRSLVLVYAVTTAVAVELSFGLNGPGYRTLIEHVSPLQGFRSLSRFAALASCSLAVLVAFGTRALLGMSAAKVKQSVLVVVLAAVMLADHCE